MDPEFEIRQSAPLCVNIPQAGGWVRMPYIREVYPDGRVLIEWRTEYYPPAHSH